MLDRIARAFGTRWPRRRFSPRLSAAIDRALVQEEAARERGEFAVADKFRRLREDLTREAGY
jgi:hypothetical protein